MSLSSPKSAAAPSRRRTRVLGLVVIASVALAGCYRPPDPTEWGKAARDNFVRSCSVITDAADGTTTTQKLADGATCGCIYDAMVNDFNLTWDEMKEYEKKIADTPDDGSLPTPPAALTKATERCQAKGPAVPAADADADADADTEVTTTTAG